VCRAVESWFLQACRSPGIAHHARLYTIEQADPYHMSHRSEPYHRPRVKPVGWLQRRSEWFGPPLTPPPGQQRLATDRAFEHVTVAGDVLPPTRSNAATRWVDVDHDAA
jgi:hypothetical protein